MDELMAVLEVPSVGHRDAMDWRTCGPDDFEDTLQVSCAIAGRADAIVTRNVSDFANWKIPAMTPGEFLASHP